MRSLCYHVSVSSHRNLLSKVSNQSSIQGLSDFLFVFCLMLAGERNDELVENVQSLTKQNVVAPSTIQTYTAEVSHNEILYEYLKKGRGDTYKFLNRDGKRL